MARSRKPSRPQAPQARRPVLLTLIALLKLVKAALLIAVGVGAIRFLHKDVAATVNHWIHVLHIDPDNRFVHRALEKVLHVSPRQLKELSLGTFFYAALFATEGIGLLLRKRWAEYFTIVTTGLFIPLEIYEIARHFTFTRVIVTTVNLLIVMYLIARVRRNPKKA